MGLGLAAGLVVLATAQGPISDLDVYWHILAGRELTDGTPATALGETWSFAPDPLPWVTTQWLTEVLLSWLAGISWATLAAFRVVTCAAAIGVLASHTLRDRPAVLAGFPFLLAVAAVGVASRERPQQFTLVGAAVMGGILIQGMTGARLPRWWLVALGTTLWANLHGGWALAPATLGLVCLGRVLDHGIRDPGARRAALLAGVSTLSGLLTPAGASGLFATARIRDSASLILEWQPTTPTRGVGLLTLAMLGVLAIGWVRSPHVPASELLVAAALFVFAWSAGRNIAPGLLILAPLVAERLALAFPGVGHSEPRWSRPIGVAAFCGLTLVGLASLIGRDHLPIDSQPIALARQIGETGSSERVLNDYNAAGIVLFFGGDGTRVGIDGRTDRYGKEYIEGYVGLTDLEGDWQSALAELAPTSALIRRESALAHVLTEERRWKTLGNENGWVLLRSP